MTKQTSERITPAVHSRIISEHKRRAERVRLLREEERAAMHKRVQHRKEYTVYDRSHHGSGLYPKSYTDWLESKGYFK